MRNRALAAAAAITAVVLALVALRPAGAATTPLSATSLVNPLSEARNLLVSQQRQAQFDSPAFVARLAQATLDYQLQRTRIDAGRHPNPNPCTTVVACPVDPRLNDFPSHGGIVKQVLYTARDGATLSGHVWATVAGPAKRPGVLIINGSIVGFDQLYWFAAQALAQAGFVVLTFDVQGEGMSDQFGQAPDTMEGAYAGTPVLGLGKELGGSGLPFYDGGEDSLNFFLSTPTHPYVPVPSRTTGTSHAAKQAQRVAAGLDTAYNPLWQMLDATEIGVAGHSYGAQAASYLAQADPRVDAAVAWDSLCRPVSPAQTETASLLTSPINRYGLYGFDDDCFATPPGSAPKLTKPALGISSDYLLTPEPYLLTPDPNAKALASTAYTAAGVDTGQIVIRGGTHFEFNDTATGLIPASKRGIDLTTWYTTAWFDKYLKHDPNADAMLLTSRWRTDAPTAAVDPSRNGNVYSYHYVSRLDIHRTNGTRYDCENLGLGCSEQSSATTDCGPAGYSFLAVDTAAIQTTVCPTRK